MDLKTSETNDCTVRAIADAYDVPYEKAHEICENGQGFYIQSEVLTKLGLILHAKFIDMKVVAMLRQIQRDKVYLCLISGHIVAIKNGLPVECGGGFVDWTG